MEEKKTLLASYEQDEDKYEQLIAANEKASQEVERLIAAATSSSSGSTTVYTGGKLNWALYLQKQHLHQAFPADL